MPKNSFIMKFVLLFKLILQSKMDFDVSKLVWDWKVPLFWKSFENILVIAYKQLLMKWRLDLV